MERAKRVHMGIVALSAMAAASMVTLALGIADRQPLKFESSYAPALRSVRFYGGAGSHGGSRRYRKKLHGPGGTLGAVALRRMARHRSERKAARRRSRQRRAA